MIFRPQRIITTTPQDYGLPYEEIFIAVGGEAPADTKVQAWWIPAAGPGNGLTLLYLHGSALNISANVEHARRFQQLGFSVLLISYRGYGRSSGAFPSEKRAYADAAAAWHYLTIQRGIPPQRILIYGHSLGGAVAIDLAVRQPEAAGVIVEATFTSIADMAVKKWFYRMFPIRLILDHHFDSLAKIKRLRVPILFLHGDADRFVPFDMSRRLYANARQPKRLVLIPGGGHNNSARVGGKLYLKAVSNFVAAWSLPKGFFSDDTTKCDAAVRATK
jgi:pimeloyl-ACP methyl ester carboxylesterase